VGELTYTTCLGKCGRDFMFTKEQVVCVGDATNMKELANCFRKERKEKPASQDEQLRKVQYEVDKLQQKVKELQQSKKL